MQSLGSNYLWSNESAASIIFANASGKYWVNVTYAAGCSFIDTIHLIDGSFTFDIGKDTMLCYGQKLLLRAKDSNYSVLWSSGQTKNTLSVFKKVKNNPLLIGSFLFCAKTNLADNKL